jgi:3-hydroxyisobutyrate dehydrogenase
MNKVVGFVGLGSMGKEVARNVLKAGFSLLPYDVRREPVEEMIQLGASDIRSVKEVGTADTVIVMVLNYPQVEQVILGVDGLASTLKPGSTVIVSSTISPSQAKSLAAALDERQIGYIDAPVSGGKARAAAGTLTVMVGASKDALLAHRSVLESFSANLYYCGPVGMGQLAKMFNQLMYSNALVATAECVALGTACGMDLRLMYDIISHGTGDSWIFRDRAERMIARDFTGAGGCLDILVKDLGIVLQTAEHAHVPLLLTTAARQWAMIASSLGHGEEDDSAVLKVLEKLTGKTEESC